VGLEPAVPMLESFNELVLICDALFVYLIDRVIS